MVTFEQVEQLRKIANVSYTEAQEALEASHGDMLELRPLPTTAATTVLKTQEATTTRSTTPTPWS